MNRKVFTPSISSIGLFLLAVCFVMMISPAKLVSMPIEQSDVKRAMLMGGEERQKAIWYVYQLQYNDLLRKAVMYLFSSSNFDDHRAVLRVLAAYGESLENHLPDWYLFLDQYMKFSVPDDILIDCFNLIVFWQEQRMIYTMARFAYHPSMKVRMGLFEAMSKMGNDVLLPVILKLFDSERAVYRMYALEATYRYYDSRLLPFIMKLMNDENKSVRIYAMETLSRRTEYAEEIIRKYTLDVDDEVRARAIEIVGKNNWRKHIYLVQRGISDRSVIVRSEAFSAVKTLKDYDSAFFISNQLEKETEYKLKDEGLEILMFLKKGGGGKGISRMLEVDENETLRLRAALAAGLTAEAGTGKALIGAVENDPSFRVRLEAAHSMGLIKSREFIPVLRAVSFNQKEHLDVRTQALISLVEIDPVESRDHIRNMKDRLKDPYLIKQIEAITQKLDGE